MGEQGEVGRAVQRARIPQRGAAVEVDRAEGVGFGEAFDGGDGGGRATAEVFDGGVGGVAAGCDDARGGVEAQAFDLAQAEP